MVKVINEGGRNLDFLLSEAEHQRSRENIVIASGSGIVKAGTVLGQITASGKFAPHDAGLSNGVQNAAAVVCYTVDATSVDVAVAGIVRACQLIGDCLIWKAAISGPNKAAGIASLNGKGLIVRPSL